MLDSVDDNLVGAIGLGVVNAYSRIFVGDGDNFFFAREILFFYFLKFFDILTAKNTLAAGLDNSFFFNIMGAGGAGRGNDNIAVHKIVLTDFGAFGGDYDVGAYWYLYFSFFSKHEGVIIFNF